MKVSRRSVIRSAVLDALKAGLNTVPDVVFFDGEPVFVDGETELPAVAVFLSDAQPDNEYLDERYWQAILHIQVFLRAGEPDRELDKWVDNHISPVMRQAQRVRHICVEMVQSGCEYLRGEEDVAWSAVDMLWNIKFKED
ncbi:phage tail protein [Salmonella enterica]|nr:phage tail protein [Salmonella enterica]EHZ8201934.1 phage tail protein [Salmonella enterica]